MAYFKEIYKEIYKDMKFKLNDKVVVTVGNLVGRDGVITKCEENHSYLIDFQDKNLADWNNEIHFYEEELAFYEQS